MRNQLITRAISIPDLVYAVEGQLDGHPVELHAWSQGRITLDMGFCNLSLTAAAAAELATHIGGAVSRVLEVQGGVQ